MYWALESALPDLYPQTRLLFTIYIVDFPNVSHMKHTWNIEKQDFATRFVTDNYNYETGSMTGILGLLKCESLKKRRKDNRLILLYKVLKVKPVHQQMTLSPKLCVGEISTLWHFRLPLLIQMFIEVASSPVLSGIGMLFPILWSHLLKMQRIVLLSSLLWWELGTNSLSQVLVSDCRFGVSPVTYPDPGQVPVLVIFVLKCLFAKEF